ncbi:retinal dehydrogenase 2-like [Watersipora subatra]|uniref:retinal dehydrogenase 2-like n=1 Tax=Watersipora subatra TaxID=2589382 RepID=UPI00355C2C7B
MTSPNRNLNIEFTKLFINNEWSPSTDGKVFPTFNPANEEKICDVSEASQDDVDKAVKAADTAFKRNSPWRSMDASGRGKILGRVADIMEQQKGELASIETLNTGKPYLDAVQDVEFTIDVYRYHGCLADKLSGKTIQVDGPYFSYTRPEPVGVCALILPWNYPLSIFAWKVGPALACGNTVVVKPSELSPLTALCQAAAFAEAGLPAGVLNVVNGYGPTTGAALATHPLVRKVAFTGSTATGKKVMTMAAEGTLKKLTLELGGKSPLVVFPDANLESAAISCHNSIMINSGQNCCAGSRVFVHTDIYDEFVEKAVACAQNRVVGDPFDSLSANGSLISEMQMKKVLAYIEKGKAEGAKLKCGGERIGDKGFFVQPTVFSGVTDDMTIAKEEIFGPVQSILKFTDIEDVLDRCNNTDYGLAAGVFTSDVNNATYMAHNLKGGTTWVNCADIITHQTPFGGFKGSGFGKELGEDAMKEYCDMKTITIQVINKNS